MVDDNFKALGDLYQTLKRNRFTRLMITLELIVKETRVLEAGMTLVRSAGLSGVAPRAHNQAVTLRVSVSRR